MKLMLKGRGGFAWRNSRCTDVIRVKVRKTRTGGKCTEAREVPVVKARRSHGMSELWAVGMQREG